MGRSINLIGFFVCELFYPTFVEQSRPDTPYWATLLQVFFKTSE